MPPEPLPFDRKDFFKARKPSSSDPVGTVPPQWREPPTTPSNHNNRGSSSSCRLAGGGPSDFRQPFSGYDKAVSGGFHVTTVESGSREYKYCKNDNSKENNTNNSRMSVALGSQKPLKGGNSWATTLSLNGNSYPLTDSVNSWEQLQLNDQHAKKNGGEVSTTGSQGLDKEDSLDWKPLKWIRSGSLSSRGSGFSHSSSCKIIRLDSLDTKIDAQLGNSTPVQSPSGDVVLCLTPRTPADEVSSRKKPRLGWGEGLAKYEKKKVGPYDIVDKESGARNGMVDGVSCSEPLLSSPSNLLDKSPSLTGCSESASPTTPYSFACSSSPGLEEKDGSIKAATVDNGTCNPNVASLHLSQNHTEGLAFNLENLEITEGFNLSSSLEELLQSDESGAPGNGFVESTAMDKLQVWKADISRTLEITETEIDSLEHELKLLISDGGSCPFPAASSSSPTERNNKNPGKRFVHLPLKIISSVDMLMEKADGFLEERTGAEDLDRKSPGTATSKLVKPLALCNNVKHPDAVERKDSPSNLDIRSEQAKFPPHHANDDMVGVVNSCRDGSQVPTGSGHTIPIGGDVYYGSENKLCDMILASNRDLANRASDAFSKMLPTTHLRTNISSATDVSLIKKKMVMRKRFIKFKERVITLKFRALQYPWKEDLRLLSIKRFSAKSQKKFELSSRMGYADHQKHDSSSHSRLSSAGSLSLVPTTEIVDYVKKLLSDSQIKIYKNTLKMPSFMLDKREYIASRFISDNGLLENPIDVEKERSIVNPWTIEEKEIFLDKYSLFGKNFRKIASFLEHKTIADCVEFYYKYHKSDFFQKTKKNKKFANGKSYTANIYLVTSGKRLNRDTNATSLDMLGAASATVANMDDGMQKQHKYTANCYVGSSSDKKLPGGDVGILERSNNFAMSCNEQETAAADVLAGICGSMSSDALSSCITSSVEPGRRCQKLGGSSLHLTPEGTLDDVDEDTCSDNSCGEDMDPCDWMDEEKSSFMQAVRSYGKDFSMISRYMRTRSTDECRVFFSKARKCLGLDVIHLEAGSEGTTGANQGGGSDHEDACGSVVSHDKSSSECNKIDLHSSDIREEHAESDRNGCREPELMLENLVSHAEKKPQVELIGESGCSNRNLEGAADSEATETTNAHQNMYSEGSVEEMNDYSSATGVAKVSAKICRQGIRESEHPLPSFNGNTSSSVRRLSSCPAEDLNFASHYSRGTCLDLSIDRGNNMELNASSENGFLMLNFFPKDPGFGKTLSQDDVSSRRLSFRKSGDQRCSSMDGYHLHLSKRSLLDCEESSHILPVSIPSAKEGKNGSLSWHEPQSNFKLEEMDCSVSQEPRQSCSLERPRRSGDVKLFGQILTNLSGSNANGSARESSSIGKPNGGRLFNLEFDNDKKNVPPSRSYGFWDGNRIQTLPDSAMLLAKYPAAFSNTSSSKFDSCSLNQTSD
ncbi:uncharacterized protein LOC112500097 isoform X1 [Cynara cardunculus var. scolymus]|uniref:uncharacterized protein LOC112500097 isoform X1 n=1 Tax=Cynara cardunculus var. scolymus TaxID=59895 RepID=UPI000D627B80|nr:uncharacterized protein LOC112500097 isoform X1 [Cynara cardunculus var. scolymus]